jgi:hypothetical protein
VRTKGRGTSNTNTRGSSADRRKRKDFLLRAYGDGLTVKCWECPAILTAETMTVDREVPGIVGGSYWDKWNIRPHCASCSRSQGWKVRRLVEEARKMTEHLALTDAQDAALRGLIVRGGMMQDWESAFATAGFARATLVELADLGLVLFDSRYGGTWNVELAGRTWVTMQDALIEAPPETPAF